MPGRLCSQKKPFNTTDFPPKAIGNKLKAPAIRPGLHRYSVFIRDLSFNHFQRFHLTVISGNDGINSI